MNNIKDEVVLDMYRKRSLLFSCTLKDQKKEVPLDDFAEPLYNKLSM
jgi:hypothetical protein